ncbi:Mur ligase domain-containing protein [Virgibacillus dakarensis]|uniref:Mur ligase domain-containing protein n=1 Tax=Virgibacillus dakarensis TaxID=1917889 RepID=UPI001F388473|nr:Mur ligase domain-containing protein [Virgibacillus dakarensis]
MKLLHLLNGLEIEYETIEKLGDISIQGIADSSLDVEKDFVFVAIKGFNINGHKFIKDSARNGASVIVGEEDVFDLPAPYLKVKIAEGPWGLSPKTFMVTPLKINALLVLPEQMVKRRQVTC